MILDDVFVNFDADRTRTACAVLRDFARQGHQLLVFTCHEHVWRMFQELKVDARRIPNRHGETEELVAMPPEPPAVEPIIEAYLPEPAPRVSEVIEETPPVLVVEDIEVEPAQELVVAEQPPAPRVEEVEYWWQQPAPVGWDHGVKRESPLPNGWLPEPVIYPERW